MKVNILILFVFLTLNIKSQNIYFLQGHPFEQIDKRFESVLYKCQPDTLVRKYVISTAEESLLFIKIYYDYNKLFAYKSGWFYNGSKRLIIIDLANPEKIVELNFDTLKYDCYDSWLVTNNENYLCLDFFNRNINKKNILLGVNLKTLIKKELQTNELKNITIIGSPGGAIQSDDYLNVYSSMVDGKLYIPITSNIENRPIFPVELPENMWLREKKLLSIIVNTQDYFVLPTKWTDTEEKEIGSSWLAILNKNSNQWYQFKIKGNLQQIRIFSNWIAGQVVTSNVKEIKDNQGKIQDRIFINRISPGMESRKKENTKTGAPFDDRTNFLKLFYPGILYLLNLSTEQYIEWETGQGDSEILLVQQDIVYYRINDEIYKAPIINNEKLGKPILLVKDKEIVPDIHWAFISEE